MLIATDELNFTELLGYQNDPGALRSYVESLVPAWASNIPGIYDNQRFYVAVKLRNTISLPYKTRLAMANSLIENTHLRGLMSNFVTLDTMLKSCDTDILCKLLESKYEQFG